MERKSKKLVKDLKILLKLDDGSLAKSKKGSSKADKDGEDGVLNLDLSSNDDEESKKEDEKEE
jgi:hypothetical protein